jgi:hypothetical protein
MGANTISLLQILRDEASNLKTATSQMEELVLISSALKFCIASVSQRMDPKTGLVSRFHKQKVLDILVLLDKILADIPLGMNTLN